MGNNKHQIIILDGDTVTNGEISWDQIESIAPTAIYANLKESTEIIKEAVDATILIANKSLLSRGTLEQLPKLKYICIAATGYNNVDLDACRSLGIQVSNVIGYSANSVVQHIFAIILYHINRPSEYFVETKNGVWSGKDNFSYWNRPWSELKNLTLGILGFGSIGQSLAKLGLAFGMKVISTHTHPERDFMEGCEFVDSDHLLKQSDILSLNVPLTPITKYFINKDSLSKMKPTSILINTARGGLIHTEDLKVALLNKTIQAAFLDVLEEEPPPSNHPLLAVDNCYITPHMAWSSVQSRERLITKIADNIHSFLKGETINELVGLS